MKINGRVMRAVCGAAVALVLCFAVIGQEKAAVMLIRAQGLTIVDKNGRERLRIETDSDRFDVSLLFYDVNGRRRCEVGMLRNGKMQLGMFDKGDNQGLLMSTDGDGRTAIDFSGAGGTRRLSLTCDPSSGDASFEIKDPQGNDSLAIQSMRSGESRLRFFGKGKELLLVGLDTTGRPEINLNDENATRRILLHVEGTGSPHLALFDRDSRPVVGLGLDTGDLPRLILMDGNQVPRAYFGIDDTGRVALILRDKDQVQRTGYYVGANGDPVLFLGDKDESSGINLRMESHEPHLVFRVDKSGCGVHLLIDGKMRESRMLFRGGDKNDILMKAGIGEMPEVILTNGEKREYRIPE